MSTYEWERGTLKLPSGVAPKMRKALAVTQNKYFDEVMAEAKKFWEANKTTSKKKLSAALNAEYDKYRGQRGWGSGPEMSKAKESALSVFSYMAWGYGNAKPHAPKIDDVAREIGPKANSRTTQFRVGHEGTITFKDNTAIWDVPENNHAVDQARESILGKTFFNLLDKVEWKRGTGGEIVGNNEYNREADYAGGGANYVTGGFGPLGDPFWKAKQAAKRAPTPRTTGTHHLRTGTVTKQGVARTGTVAKNPTRKLK
jgi:hypothetical protein